MTIPSTARTTATTTSSLLLLGIENPAPLRPAQAKNTTSSTMWITPPAMTFSPIPVTASAGGTPAFCMYRTLRAMPPTFAGVTRLTNDEANWASTVAPNGSGSETPPRRPIAAATYVKPDVTMDPASHPQLADRRAWKLQSTLD